MVERLPRLRGEKRHHIQYHHIIDWLAHKPGAFDHYRYRDDLFPTTYFRMAYDSLKTSSPVKQAKDYLTILHLAAIETESEVNHALRLLLDSGESISVERVKSLLDNQIRKRTLEWYKQVLVQSTDLKVYDGSFIVFKQT